MLPSLFAPGRSGRFALLLGIGAGQAVCVIAAALAVRQIFHLLSQEGTESGSALALAATSLLAASILLGGLRMAERVVSERLGQSYIGDLRLSLFDRLAALAPRSLFRRSRGAVMLRFVGDLTALRQWVSLGLARLLVAGATCTILLTVLLVIDWRLGTAAGLVLLAGGILAMRVGERLHAVIGEARRHRSRLAANVNEKIASMPVVQIFGQVQRERRRLRQQSRNLAGSMVERARMTGALRAITETTGAVVMGLVLIVGSREVAAGRITVATLVAVIAIIGLMIPPLRDLGRVHEYWKGAQVARDKISRFLELPTLVPESPGARRLRQGEGRLRFQRVTLYGSLQQVSATAGAGRLVVVTGANGAGKSTLLALAARLIDPDRGRVILDGRNIADVRLSSLRRAIGMVGPDLPLLRGSLMRNLCYRHPRADATELQRIIELCGVDHILEQLPEGLGTRIQEGGLNLSTGQRQRIALARAMLGQPRLLLLDEVDAFLDPAGTAILERVLEQFEGTVLMVTQRPERMARADDIWVLEQGILRRRPPAGPVSGRVGIAASADTGRFPRHADDRDRPRRTGAWR